MNDPKANLELIKEFGINGYESIRSLTEINLRTWEKVIGQQLSTLDMLVNSSVQQASSASTDPAQLLQSQAALSEELIGKGREAIDLATEAGNEYRSWLENGISTFNSKVNAATEEASK